ncbi:right-handed parallel beta-helix repeat-containing protein [Pantoea sp. App145]|uniref:right-handed parallel beta-helix repeat-containing protein n=1 Tax=Pantoea sp. App145 TaxID=3071567 RepID=UPI003A8088C3
MLQEKKEVNIPAGKYVIDDLPIRITSNSRLSFSKDAIIKVNKNKKNESSVFIIDGESDIEFEGGAFYSYDDTVEVIKVVNNAHGISIKNVSCNGCRLFVSDVMKSYNLINDMDLNDKITISNCEGGSEKIKTRRAFIELHYTKNSECEGCVVDGYYHGMMFWGGDSNPNKDGAESNKRKVYNIRFSNNNIKNVQLGGIWGSMGKSVSIDSNNISHGRDVGVDFEGCTDSQATNNIIKDFRHGNLATFFLCKNILFENNTSISTRKENIVAAIFNSTLNQANRNLKFINNTFIGDGVNSYFEQNGTVNDLIIKNNSFSNVSIKLMSPNNGRLEISDNTFFFKIFPDVGTFVVSVSNVMNHENNINLENNNVNSLSNWFLDKPVFNVKVLKPRNLNGSPIIRGNLVEKKSSQYSTIISVTEQK